MSSEDEGGIRITSELYAKYFSLSSPIFIFAYKSRKQGMSNSYFQFKQFTISQDKCAMKVGTDGVLLGAWANVEQATNILDIGTGTGLVALMAAQRSQARITGLEIDADAASQAMENVSVSPWKDRVIIIREDFCTYNTEEKFDAIVSNPPYFINSQASPNGQRNIARHCGRLDFRSLVWGASRLLAEAGELSLILPAYALPEVSGIARENGLYPARQLNIKTIPEKEAGRILIAFRPQATPFEEDEILIEKGRHIYSDEYIALTKAFYLYM